MASCRCARTRCVKFAFFSFLHGDFIFSQFHTTMAAAKLAPGDPTTVQKGVQYRKDMCAWYFTPEEGTRWSWEPASVDGIDIPLATKFQCNVVGCSC